MPEVGFIPLPGHSRFFHSSTKRSETIQFSKILPVVYDRHSDSQLRGVYFVCCPYREEGSSGGRSAGRQKNFDASVEFIDIEVGAEELEEPAELGPDL